MKIIIGLVVIVIASLTILAFSTAKPAEAINNCYEEGQRNLQYYEGKTDQESCTNNKNEIATLKQCLNNTYAKYGKLQSTLAKKQYFMTKKDPLPNLIDQHNKTCAIYPDTQLK
jgi:hypothetical protein